MQHVTGMVAKVLFLAALWSCSINPAHAANIRVNGLVEGMVPAGGVDVVAFSAGTEVKRTRTQRGAFELLVDERVFADGPVCIDLRDEVAFAQAENCLADPSQAGRRLMLVATEKAYRRSADLERAERLIQQGDFAAAEARLFAFGAPVLGYAESPHYFVLWTRLIHMARAAGQPLRPQTLDVAAALAEPNGLGAAFAALPDGKRAEMLTLFANALQQGFDHEAPFPPGDTSGRVFELVVDVNALTLGYGGPRQFLVESSRFCLRKLAPVEQVECLDYLAGHPQFRSLWESLADAGDARDAAIIYLRNLASLILPRAAELRVAEARGQGRLLQHFTGLVDHVFGMPAIGLDRGANAPIHAAYLAITAEE